MRPWFTLTIIAIIAGCLLSFWLIVDFVLLNRVMFETPFNIAVRLPFPPWFHRWTEVQFMYILTVGVLLGAGIMAVTTLIVDTKRALKVRRMKKELARLQKALEEAQAKLPPPLVPENANEKDSSVETVGELETLPFDTEAPDDEESITPEEITHSFEDVVEQGDFLKVAQKRVEDELERHGGRRPEGDIRAIVTGSSEELPAVSEQDEDVITSENDTEVGEGNSDVTPEETEPVDESLQKDSSAEDVVNTSADVVSETEQKKTKPLEAQQDNATQESVADGNIQATDDTIMQDTEQEFSPSEQESKDDDLDSKEPSEPQQHGEGKKHVPEVESENVDDIVPVKKTPDES